MEGNPGRGTPGGETYPQLLDLIASGKKWMERDGGGGARDDLSAAEEKQLELRLGPPGVENWRVAREKKEELSVPSLGFLPRPCKCTTNTSAGAKRGFMDTLESQVEGMFL